MVRTESALPAMALVSVARIQAVEAAQQGLPLARLGGSDAGIPPFPVARGVLGHACGGEGPRPPRVVAPAPDAAPLLEEIQAAKRLGDAAAHGDDAMIAQQHDVARAEIRDQAPILCLVER